MPSEFIKVRDEVEAWISGNKTAKTAETDVLSFIAGSYGIVLAVYNKVEHADFQALKTGMLTAGEAAYVAAPGDVLAKLAAAGAASLAAGVALLAGDLAVAFKDVTDAERANLLHTLSTSSATEAGIPAATA